MRLIDADAFKKILSEHEMKHDKRRSFDDYDCGAANAYEHASDLLDDMPTITIPVAELDTTEDFGKWVLCSDRLPEEHGYYIVQTDGSHNAVIDIAEYGKFFRKPEYECVWEWNKASRVIAWMPLPEPYKKEGDGNADEIPKD